MSIIGHKQVCDRLEQALRKGVLSHAYIFYGPTHVGKHMIAERFARSIITGVDMGALDEHEDVRWRQNLLQLQPEKEKKKDVIKMKPIGISAIRGLQKKIALLPGGDGRQVLIINDAHIITREAQNAFLKTLEEPPKNTFIILVAENKNIFLSTIISRCEEVFFGEVSTSDLLGSAVDLSSEQQQEYADLAMGRPGIYISMLQDEALWKKRKAYADMWKSLKASSLRKRMQLAQDLSKDVPSALELLEFCIYKLRRSVRAGEIKDVQYVQTVEVTFRGLDILRSSNANSRLVIENIFLAL